MKPVWIIFFLTMSAHLAFGQHKVKNDPTYSVNNYKHPNKAAFARAHDLDESYFLTTTKVSLVVNYKQPSNKIITTATALPVRKAEKVTQSYKHPYGL